MTEINRQNFWGHGPPRWHEMAERRYDFSHRRVMT
jgi:hypothetical protein